MKNQDTHITFTTDTDGTDIAHVPVRNDFATIEKDDLAELERKGVSLNWYLKVANGNGYVCAYDPDHLGGNLTIARTILGAGQRKAVRYCDGNRLNLRRDNLYIGAFQNATGPTPRGGSDFG
ncbi:hypothetical protein [Maricaulis maris]|uniref:hypothetical protein n=1 Tax=Maricaulis maris TaxID=74318 RepID=UPI003A949279